MLRSIALAMFVVFVFVLVACAGSDGPPPPGARSGIGSIGAACVGPYDCASGFCCKSPPCRGGMCTFQCRDDFDCPNGARCDGGACFWSCFDDRDCALGQTCKRQHTICQY